MGYHGKSNEVQVYYLVVRSYVLSQLPPQRMFLGMPVDDGLESLVHYRTYWHYNINGLT